MVGAESSLSLVFSLSDLLLQRVDGCRATFRSHSTRSRSIELRDADLRLETGHTAAVDPMPLDKVSLAPGEHPCSLVDV